MKNTKRVLSLLIVVVMLFASLSLVSVSAEDKQFTLTLNTTCEVISEAYDTAHLDFTAPENGLYHFYSTSSLNTEATLYDENGFWMNCRNEYKNGYNFNITAYLEKGKTYTLQTYYCFEDGLNAYCINVKPADAFVNVTDVSYEENSFIKYTPSADGCYSFYTISESYSSIYVYEEEAPFALVYSEGKCFLEEGHEYTIEVETFADDSEEVMVVAEKAVYAMEASVVSEPEDKTIVRNFEEDTFNTYGLEVEFTMSDGSSCLWTEGYVNGSYVHCSLVGLEGGKKSAKSTETITCEINCDQAYEYIYFDVIDNPIESIEYIGDPIICYENTCGEYKTDINGDEFFFYDYTNPYGDCIKINYTDGTSETATINEFKYDIRVRDEQWQTHWTKGLDNFVYAYCLDKKADIPVQIQECPVESITVNSAPTYKYTYGDDMFGELTEDGEYIFTPNQYLGINLTVKYKDGTTEVVTQDTFFDLPYNHYCFNEISVYGACTTKAELIFKGFKVEYDIVVKDYSSGPAGLIGDANIDEEINIKDATLIQKSLALLEELSSTGETLADVDNDYKITIKDATAIQKHIAGMDTGYPIGEYIY